MKCNLCQGECVVRGIQQVCLGCGNTTRSNALFSTEQEFQNINVRRTTQHIKQRQDKQWKIQETLMEHLQKHWIQYLKAFGHWYSNLAESLKLSTNIWQIYLINHTNQQIHSNWTVARRGHEMISLDRRITSKYYKGEIMEIKEEEEDLPNEFEQELLNFEQEQQQLNNDSVMELMSKKIKKSKSPFYLKRKLKHQLQQTAGQRSARKMSRRGSINQINPQGDKNEFFENILNNLTMNESLYLALVETYFERYYQNKCVDIDTQIRKIKNIKQLQKDHTKEIKIQELTQQQLKKLRPYMQIEICLLIDYLTIVHKVSGNFIEMYQQFSLNHPQKPTINAKIRNVSFLNRKINKIYNFLIGESTKQEKNSFPLDFTLSLIMLYASSLNIGSTLTPTELITKIKTKQIPYLEGFGSYLNEPLNQYLTYPQHVPKSSFIRKRTIIFMKQFNIPQKQFDLDILHQILKQIAIQLNINQDFYNIIRSQKIQKECKSHEYDLFACSIIYQAFQFFLEYDNEKAIDQLIKMLKKEDRFPLDYGDLEYVSLHNLKLHLQQECNYESYYHDEHRNLRMNQKFKKLSIYYENVNAPIAADLQILEIKFEQKEYETCSQLAQQSCLRRLCEYLEEEEHSILQFM